MRFPNAFKQGVNQVFSRVMRSWLHCDRAADIKQQVSVRVTLDWDSTFIEEAYRFVFPGLSGRLSWSWFAQNDIIQRWLRQ